MIKAALATTGLAYIDRGKGRPILLVHGFPLDHTMWNPQIEVLSDQYRVIAPDLRGFGQSLLGQIDPTRGLSMEQYADDLSELLDALQISEPIALLGLSMGGYIAWQFIRKFPKRVRSLVQLDTRAIADNDEARAGRIKMAENVAEWGAARVAEMMGPKLFRQQAFTTQPEIITATRRVVESTSPAAISAAQRGMAARPDVTDQLPKITVPTLVIVGDQDVISPPAEMQSIAAAIPGAKFVVIPDSGHMTTLEQPDAVNEALLRFLEGVSRRA
jgi:3-oxoadipate enol-lactonase